MVSILTLGAMVGALANGPIADRLSRRWSILLANVFFLIGSIIQAAAVNIPMIFVGRFIAGLAIGQLSMVVPLYLSELAPPNLRGSLVSLQQLSITLGIMVAFWLDYGTQNIGGTGDTQSPVAWRLPLALQCFPSIILAIGTFFLPYSPRWLLLKGRPQTSMGFSYCSFANENNQIANKMRFQPWFGSVVCQRQTLAFNSRFSKSWLPRSSIVRQLQCSTQMLPLTFNWHSRDTNLYLCFPI